MQGYARAASFKLSCAPFDLRWTGRSDQLLREKDVRRAFVEIDAKAVLWATPKQHKYVDMANLKEVPFLGIKISSTIWPIDSPCYKTHNTWKVCCNSILWETENLFWIYAFVFQGYTIPHQTASWADCSVQKILCSWRNPLADRIFLGIRQFCLSTGRQILWGFKKFFSVDNLPQNQDKGSHESLSLLVCEGALQLIYQSMK